MNDLLKDLLTTASDRRLTRSERKAVRALLAEAGLSDAQRQRLVDGLFHAAADRLRDPRDRELLGWLEDMVRLVSSGRQPFAPSRAWFGPEDPMVESVLDFMADTRSSLDVAVFTITDDRLTRGLLDLHSRGVAVRILSDGDKSRDAGSDVQRLARAGVPTRTDRSEAHFHHKFAVRDGRAVLTGSYNWTRGADRDNRENFLVSWEPPLVSRYREAFERLWEELG